MEFHEMQDKLVNANDKLAVLLALFSSNDADLSVCHDGLAMFTESIGDDVCCVLEALDERIAAESRQKDSDTNDDTEGSTDGFTMAQVVAIAKELGVHYEDMANAISKVGEATA